MTITALPIVDEPPRKLALVPARMDKNLCRQYPNMADISLTHIANELSRLPLYKEHINGEYIYSIAIRSCWMASYLCRKTGDANIAIHALLHWAPLAFLQVETFQPESAYTRAEIDIKEAIYRKLELPFPNLTHTILLDEAFSQAQLVELEAMLPAGCLEHSDLSAQKDEFAQQLSWMEPMVPCIVSGAFQQYFETLKRGEQV